MKTDMIYVRNCTHKIPIIMHVHNRVCLTTKLLFSGGAYLKSYQQCYIVVTTDAIVIHKRRPKWLKRFLLFSKLKVTKLLEGNLLSED